MKPDLWEQLQPLMGGEVVDKYPSFLTPLSESFWGSFHTDFQSSAVALSSRWPQQKLTQYHTLCCLHFQLPIYLKWTYMPCGLQSVGSQRVRCNQKRLSSPMAQMDQLCDEEFTRLKLQALVAQSYLTLQSLDLLFAIPWTVACWAPLSMEFSRSGLPFRSPGDLPNPGIEPRFPTLQTDSLPSAAPGKPIWRYQGYIDFCPVVCFWRVHATNPSNNEWDRKYREVHGIFETHCLCNAQPVQQSAPAKKAQVEKSFLCNFRTVSET